jgi:P27 family predicted phage terminase small subunit
VARTGRPTKPQALRELTDSHHRRYADSEPVAAGPVNPPRNLTKEARRHWRRLAGVLGPLGLLTSVDTDAFSMLCFSLAQIDECRRKITELGGSVVAHKGRPILNPYNSVLRSAEATALKLMGEFGITPSAKTRIFSSAVAPAPVCHHPNPDIAEQYFEDTEGEGKGTIQ